MQIDPADRHTVLAHYYRAMVGRADIWRMRMDATTNWAIGTTAAMISFALGNAAAPHSVVFMAVLLTVSFLFLEARRLTFYHLWQQRVLLLERGLIASALRSEPVPADGTPDLEAALEAHLGRTVPSMPLSKAVARRLRRIYLYLFGVQLIAWLFKLSTQPIPTSSLAEIVARAHVGDVPGEMLFPITCLGYVALVGLATLRGGVDGSVT